MSHLYSSDEDNVGSHYEAPAAAAARPQFMSGSALQAMDPIGPPPEFDASRSLSPSTASAESLVEEPHQTSSAASRKGGQPRGRARPAPKEIEREQPFRECRGFGPPTPVPVCVAAAPDARARASVQPRKTTAKKRKRSGGRKKKGPITKDVDDQTDPYATGSTSNAGECDSPEPEKPNEATDRPLPGPSTGHNETTRAKGKAKKRRRGRR